MLFNSLQFVIFFPITTLLYFLLPHKFRWLHLLIASCIFYAAFIPAYLLILFFLIIVDYCAGILIEKGPHKKFWLIVSILSNISILALFKYFNFFVYNINQLTGSNFILLKWILPIGLSFHTFQSMSYIIEIYHDRQKAIKHLGYYALYVMFYPQLVAGPIERPQHLLPQFFKTQKFLFKNLYQGLRLMAWGFFKKVVIADRIGQYVDEIYKHPQHAGTLPILLAIFFFSIQIYADFSGYSDIATGAARCMGFDLCVNFNRPYQSKNIKEFWTRWHISLSTWFRDYVYIPLGGNRKGSGRKDTNLVLTFILSALWHGAGWTFIIWGALHAAYTIIYGYFKKYFSSVNLPDIIARIITGLCLCFAWIFFRASSLNNAQLIIHQMVNINKISFNDLLNVTGAKINMGNFMLLFSLGMICFMFLVEKITLPKMVNLDKKPVIDTFIFVSVVLLIIFFGEFQKSNFIYFQF